MKNYTEFCKEQTNKLFQIIDQHGGLLKWKKTWQVKGSFSLPKSMNGFYQGLNLWKLLNEQINTGFESDTWMTFKQVKQKGGFVLKGAKGTRICFFKIRESEAEEGDIDNQKMMTLFRTYMVFNLNQTNLSIHGSNNTVSQAPQKIQELLSILDIAVSEFGSQAYFNSTDDVIVMPHREHFNNAPDYDVTLLHELIHWSGHSSRLNRITIKDYCKSDEIRAEEELIAEIGSVFLTAYFNISGDLINHASYVCSWKKYLDTKVVGRAISQASKAFIWLINHLENQSVAAA